MHIGIWPETKEKRKNTEMGIKGQLVVLQVLLIKKKKKNCMGFAKPPDSSEPPFPQLENRNSGLITRRLSSLNAMAIQEE